MVVVAVSPEGTLRLPWWGLTNHKMTLSRYLNPAMIEMIISNQRDKTRLRDYYVISPFLRLCARSTRTLYCMFLTLRTLLCFSSMIVILATCSLITWTNTHPHTSYTHTHTQLPILLEPSSPHSSPSLVCSGDQNASNR